MISVENLSKSFGSQILFNNVNLKINSRERIGLVGRNGHGKTTFFRLIIGDEHFDDGKIITPKHYRIGYVQQHLDFTKDTVLGEGMTGLPETERNHSWKVEKILAGLGFSEKQMEMHPKDFSGGYQVRLNLAKALVSEPNLLLLDEPTNYLDITSIRWVERFLANWPNELMLITHDRSFMDSVVTHIVGIHRAKMRKLNGTTEKFYTQIAQDEEIYEKTRINDERRQKEIELFINRFRAKARLANMVQSRVKTLSKLEKKDKLDTIKTLDFSFKSKAFNSKTVMSADKVAFHYQPEMPLFENLNLTVGAHDRICVVGKNGSGKTTLLKVLAGTLPSKRGQVTYHPRLEKSFFEQTNIKTLIDERTIEEEILYSHEDVDHQMARNICGAMMFKGNDALKKIKVLSGGEKSRVMLGKILVTPANLLLLDEPSNHLDMESCDALLAAIDNFEGAVIMVTHNEMFLHALARRLIVFKNDTVSLYEGSYQHFLEKVGWEEEDFKPHSSLKNAEINDTEKKITKKEIRQKRSQIVTERSKMLTPLKKSIEKIEEAIYSQENDLNDLNISMQEASQVQNGQKIMELSQQIHKTQTKIDLLFDELEMLTEQFEEQNRLFEKNLAELDVFEGNEFSH